MVIFALFFNSFTAVSGMIWFIYPYFLLKVKVLLIRYCRVLECNDPMAQNYLQGRKGGGGSR